MGMLRAASWLFHRGFISEVGSMGTRLLPAVSVQDQGKNMKPGFDGPEKAATSPGNLQAIKPAKGFAHFWIPGTKGYVLLYHSKTLELWGCY